MNVLVNRLLSVLSFSHISNSSQCAYGEISTEDAILEAGRQGHICAFVDTAHSLDLSRIQASGLDMSKVLVSQPSSREEALLICEALARSGAIDVLIVGSLSALSSLSELEVADKAELRKESRALSLVFKRVKSRLSRVRTRCFFTDANDLLSREY